LPVALSLGSVLAPGPAEPGPFPLSHVPTGPFAGWQQSSTGVNEWWWPSVLSLVIVIEPES
jgi:hypothetical protein